MSSDRTSTGNTTFTADERAAMKERAKELKAESRRSAAKADGEAELRSKIAEMTDEDRAMAERIDAVVRASAPDLTPKTWYGMPAYARDGKIICFFQPAAKFKSRYATFGFNEDAKLDEGSMWATSWALTELTEADEARIAKLVTKAVS
jgi:uncharacterized protein YdhG (YjbR/CyaY superfamily)